ncbi:MAG: glutathione S-transferase [Burkholderiales bacterium RIFCSPLOWO2_12_FULL_67_210]|nr:MAG: glutathione S-transferase [Burkholderiales bacterium RIFCSPLOWO2_12_FULL_67_210]
MLKLCGFAASNYYNKVKLALLEKGVPFEEVLAWVGETDKAASPLGKVPYLLTERGPMCESTVILELVARNLYPEAFFGGKVSDAAKEKVGQQLEKNVAAFAKLAMFSPYIAGEQFTLADVAAAVHLPLVSSATRIIYGRDHLAELPVRDYLKRLGERPAVQRVNADRKTSTELMLQRARAAKT